MKPVYTTSNLWETFREECPILSRIPLLGMWSFGVFVKAYFEQKVANRDV